MTEIVNHRVLLRTLENLGECTIGAIRGHIGSNAPRKAIAYHLSVLQELGCVTLRLLETPQRWDITPRGQQWLRVLESAGADAMPTQPMAHALAVWLMDHPGMYRTTEIERVPEIAPLIVGKGHSAVANTLTRLTLKGLVLRMPAGPGPHGQPTLCWGIIGTGMTAPVVATAPGPEPDIVRRVPRDAPPGWWDEHWQEIEGEFRRVMTGRRPMLQVTLKREMHYERYPQGLIHEAMRRGLISVSWTRGQQYYTLVGRWRERYPGRRSRSRVSRGARSSSRRRSQERRRGGGPRRSSRVGTKAYPCRRSGRVGKGRV